MPNITIIKGLSKSIKRAAPNPDSKTVTVKKILKRPLKNAEKKQVPISDKHKLCTNLEAFFAYSTATPIRSHDGLSYTCCFCTEHYVNPADLKAHSMMAHNNTDHIREYIKKQRPDVFFIKLDITMLKCKLCDESIETVEKLFEHLQNEHKKLIYADIKNYIIPFKFGGEELQCAVCPLVFSKYKMLLEHMHTHYRNFVCEICNFGYISRRAILSHKETHKTGTFECNECNKVFENPQSRRTHVNAVHKQMNLPSKCGVCNERFKTNPLKELHMTTAHGMSPIIRKCLSCEKTFQNQQALRMHTKKYHLLERNYKCTECEKSFFSISQLKNHMLKHTGRKDFQCDVCLKWFGRKCVLKEHMRIHTNDRRFTCLKCGRGFVQKCSWRGHMRTVHGEIHVKPLATP